MLQTVISKLSPEERSAAVRAYDRRYGEMERVLWCLAENSRASLVAQTPSETLEVLVRTIKHWWGIQGPDSTAALSAALMRVEWSTEVFTTAPDRISAASDASGRVLGLVASAQELGATRREVSWSSKILHWLLPWRIPVFDQYVRMYAGVPEALDLPNAYRAVAREVFQAVDELPSTDERWLGELQPRSPLRGLDKCLWWLGGGDKNTAYVDPDPQRVLRHLSLSTS
jgi:hypothetical protein